MPKVFVEDVFVTEGVPAYTFVPPPNYHDILVDLRRKGKPVIIEGQSGTGKTTAVKKIVAEIDPAGEIRILTPRIPDHLDIIKAVQIDSGPQFFVIDDFHRLDASERTRLADIAKVIAERDDRASLPKLVIVGINNVGADVIQLVPDVAKRVGIHRIEPGNVEQITSLLSHGGELLNVEIDSPERLHEECRGDYWLAQQIARTICLAKGVTETQSDRTRLTWNSEDVRRRVVSNLSHTYDEAVKTFCRGRRFRPTNDPYFKLLRLVAQQERSHVDLNELANAHADVRGSINNVKDKRLEVLIREKAECERYFHYNVETKNFALGDPALFFYIRNLDWEDLRRRCGFREGDRDYEFDVAISFAGENRDLAKFIVDNLEVLDVHVFYDRNFEDNFLGGAWSEQFSAIFAEQSRLVVCLLDHYHHDKIWPTFERECFRPRVAEGEVIPIRLDETRFVGISEDINSIRFEWRGDVNAQADEIIDQIVMRVAQRLEGVRIQQA